MTQRNWDAETAAAMLDKRAEHEVFGEDEPMDEEEWLPDEEENVAAETVLTPPPPPPLNVRVIGSASWTELLMVQAALLNWARSHAGQPVILWTAGCPMGPEAEARDFAVRSGWSIAEATPEQMMTMDATVTFAFVAEDGDAAELAADLGARHGALTFTQVALRPKSRWNTW